MHLTPPGAGRLFLRPSASPFLALPLVAALVWLLARQLSGIDLRQVWDVTSTYGIGLWALAVLAVCASFLAIGRYDALAHQRLKTGVAPPRAARSGMRAIAAGQALGFAVVTGAVARWRGLPELGAVPAAKVTAFVGLSFLAALATLIAVFVALGLGPIPPFLDHPVLRAGIGVLALGTVFVLLRSGVRLADAARILLYSTLDTGFAALSLWLFLPPGTDFLTLYVVYLTALSAGLLSNAPGGIGAFELTLIALLPHVPLEALMSAIVAHRICFYALPLLLALPGILRPSPVPEAPLIPVRADDLPGQGAPEWDLTAQGARVLARPDLTAGWLVRPAPLSLVSIGQGLGKAGFSEFTQTARLLGRAPVLYKIDRTDALHARRAGLSVIRVAREAALSPGVWDLAGPTHRQLRRKLRQSERAGVTITPAPPDLPLDEMLTVARAWRDSHGAEKGFSMGRVSPQLLARQKVWLAYQDGALVAFVSFSTSGRQWTLDLMRHTADAPQGTMHALVLAAISAARAAEIPRLSLAAVPDFPPPLGRMGLSGLCQFKAAFAPDWAPLYAAAPGPLQLALGLAAIGWAVHHPQDDHEEFAFELRTRACEGAGQPASSLTSGASHGRRPFPSSRLP